MKLADHFIVVLQALVHQPGKARRIRRQHFRPLLEGQSLGTVAAVIGDMAGGLVAEQIHMDPVVIQVFQEIHDIAVIRNGTGLLCGHFFLCHGHRRLQAVGLFADPALGIAGHNPGFVHFGDDGHGAGNLGGLALGAGHAAQTG